jgi:death-on-curing protein
VPRRWIWVALDVIYAIHGRQIAEHGGADGVRDAALVESALMRPRNFAADGSPDAADLAAAYAGAIARNHGFVDGNKGTAWVAARLFLRLNRVEVALGPAEAVETMERVAAGLIDETQLAGWFRERIRPKLASAAPRRRPGA